MKETIHAVSMQNQFEQILHHDTQPTFHDPFQHL
jgi:hypothetical protein